MMSARTRGIIALCACVMLAIFGAAYEQQKNEALDTEAIKGGLPESAAGYGALAALLRARGIPVKYAPISLEDMRTFAGLVLVAPVSPRVVFPMLPKQVGNARIVFVPPKWTIGTIDHETGWMKTSGLWSGEDAAYGLHLFHTPTFYDDGDLDPFNWRQNYWNVLERLPHRSPIRRLRTFGAEEWDEEIGVENAHTLFAWHRGLYLLSDPDMLNNTALADKSGAETAVTLIDLYRTRSAVWIAPAFLTAAQARGGNPLPLAFQPPFVAATACMIAAALLMAWQGLVRFGPLNRPDPALAAGKSNLIDSAASLIDDAERIRFIAPAYAALCRRMVLGEGGGGNADALLRDMQARHGAKRDFFALQRRAETVDTHEAMLDLAQDLHEWQQEMTDGRK